MLKLWVIVARSLIGDVELPDNIVVSSGASAVPLPGPSNCHVLAAAGLDISEQKSCALKGSEGAAVAYQGRLPIVDCVQAIAVGNGKGLG